MKIGEIEIDTDFQEWVIVEDVGDYISISVEYANYDNIRKTDPEAGVTINKTQLPDLLNLLNKIGK